VTEPILSDADLTELRGVVVALLPDTAVILDKVEVRDTTGGIVTTYTARPEPVPCRVGNVQQADRVAASTADLDRVGVTSGHMRAAITVPALTPADIGDRVEALGVLYSVLGVLGPTSWELTRRLVCEVV
jgi:hypothetical protein